MATLAKRPDLRRLASSPLLAGLLCALHQDRNMHLPRDRRSLYEAALDLLLVRWDEDRGLALPSFSKEEQLVLLQRFAYSLVRNRELMVPREEAVHRLGNAMRGLRSHDIDPDDAMQRLLERAGLLREVASERVQFVHRTFRDYLAAKEVVDAGDLNLLVDRAHLDEWHDVVVMAVAHARPRERARVLMDLLAGNDDTRKDERGRDKLRLLALACLDQADVIEPETARAQVTAAAASLIPPKSFAHADALAEAGSFVVDLLPGPEASEEAAYIVRTLANIGGEAAWERIAEFVAVDHAMVIDELLRAWRNTPDAEKYAKSVLSKVDFGDRRVDVRGWHRIQFIMHLEKLRYVRCIGNINPLDPLGAMPSLHRLELWQNEVMRDLSPLAGSGSLKELHLSRCRPLGRIDLSPVRDLDELHLHFSRVDLESLEGGALRRLQIRDSATDDGLASLPGLPALRELAIDHRPPYPLAGLGRWPTITTLEVFGVPSADELRVLPRWNTSSCSSRNRLPGWKNCVSDCRGAASPVDVVEAVQRLALGLVEQLDRRGVGGVQLGREGEASALLQLGQRHLEHPELVQVERLGQDDVLGEQERAAPQLAVHHERDHLVELARDRDAAEHPVVGVEDRAAVDADLEVVDVDVGEHRVLEPAPEPFLGALVEVVHLRRDVREEERVLVRLLRLGLRAPAQVGAARRGGRGRAGCRGRARRRSGTRPGSAGP